MNTCKCPPPAGEIQCADDQLAMCIVENGVSRGICISPPQDTADLTTWVQQTVQGQAPALKSLIGPPPVLPTIEVVEEDGLEVTYLVGQYQLPDAQFAATFRFRLPN